MKKTLIAASIAALAAGSAQAVTLYESETGSFSTYGKIQLELQNYDGENQIQNQGSRFGFRGESQINEDLTAFTNFEFRFNAGAQNDSATAQDLDLDHMDVRNSFIGVRGGFGRVQAGNFDSAVYTQVTAAADIMENKGFTSFDGGSNNARGFAIGYQTVDLNGLVITANIRHYSSDEVEGGADYPSISASNDQEWNIQVAANYAISNELSVGFAFDQNNEDGGPARPDADGSSDPIFALGVNYATDLFGAFAVYEMNDKDWILNLGGNYSYGAGDIYGVVSVNYEDAPDKTGIDFALGANYNLASNFYVYGEFALGNDKVDRTVGDLAVVTLGANYNW